MGGGKGRKGERKGGGREEGEETGHGTNV